MDYLNIYNSLIDKAKNNVFNSDEYFETHHIIPKGMNGSNEKDNLVKMTARQHFVAHWLLFRIYPTNKQIASAFHIIAFGTNCRNTRKKHEGYMPSSRAIAEARYASVVRNTGSKHLPETIQKMKDTWQEKIKNGYIGPTNGKITSEETKEKQRQSKLGKPRPQETIDKIKATKKRQYQEYLEQYNIVKKKLSKETIKKIRDAAIKRNKGKTNKKYEEKKLMDIAKENEKRLKQKIKAEERKLRDIAKENDKRLRSKVKAEEIKQKRQQK
jgi:hypothetical protein